MEQQNPMNPQNAPQGQWQQGAQGAPYPGQQPPYPGQYQGQQYGQYSGQQQWQQAMPVSYAAPPVGFINALVICLVKKYADFSGRASSNEFASFWLLYMVTVLPGFFFVVPQWVSVCAVFVLTIPLLAVGARRLHDLNMSGWWQIILIIYVIFRMLDKQLKGDVFFWPVIFISVVGLAFLCYMFTKGKDAPNRFDVGRASQPQQFAQAQAYPQQYPAYGAAPAQGAPYPGQQPMPQQWPQGAMPPQGAQPVPPAAQQPAQRPSAQQPPAQPPFPQQ